MDTRLIVPGRSIPRIPQSTNQILTTNCLFLTVYGIFTFAKNELTKSEKEENEEFDATL